MSTEQFNVMRKELVENVTGAALDWLAYMGTPAALAAIPDTEPPRYVVAGTLADIVKLLPAAEVIMPAKGGITSLEGLTRYDICRSGDGGAFMEDWPTGDYVRFADVERLLASTAGEQAEPFDLHNAIMNLPCKRTMSHFASQHEMRAYKEGHRDARHAAAELANELAATEAAPASPEQPNAEPEANEAQKLAPILWGMCEGGGADADADIYADGYQAGDGDVYVRRAGELLIEQAAEIRELVRYVDMLSAKLAAPIAAAPAAEEVRNQAHGHREDFYLLANARSLIESPKAETRRMPNWVLAMRLFATGSTSAHQICADAGIDPDSYQTERIDRAMKRAASTEGGAA